MKMKALFDLSTFYLKKKHYKFNHIQHYLEF